MPQPPPVYEDPNNPDGPPIQEQPVVFKEKSQASHQQQVTQPKFDGKDVKKPIISPIQGPPKDISRPKLTPEYFDPVPPQDQDYAYVIAYETLKPGQLDNIAKLPVQSDESRRLSQIWNLQTTKYRYGQELTNWLQYWNPTYILPNKNNIVARAKILNSVGQLKLENQVFPDINPDNLPKRPLTNVQYDQLMELATRLSGFGIADIGFRIYNKQNIFSVDHTKNYVSYIIGQSASMLGLRDVTINMLGGIDSFREDFQPGQFVPRDIFIMIKKMLVDVVTVLPIMYATNKVLKWNQGSASDSIASTTVRILCGNITNQLYQIMLRYMQYYAANAEKAKEGQKANIPSDKSPTEAIFYMFTHPAWNPVFDKIPGIDSWRTTNNIQPNDAATYFKIFEQLIAAMPYILIATAVIVGGAFLVNLGVNVRKLTN